MRKKRKGRHNPRGKSAPPYLFEFKLRLVRLHLEDNDSVPLLSQALATASIPFTAGASSAASTVRPAWS